uniref:Formin-like protein 6 n=1 Tax=Anthurium amnicola TaxID=1678845 RepID=A0A1D1XS55_9ARAE
MALFRKFFYRKPPDGLLEISERVYVFDCCFSTEVLEDDDYKVYVGGIVSQLREHFPDASFMVFNFREGESQSQIANILSEFDMTVMDYPRHYEGCPLLTMEMIHHFLRSSESWLSLGQQNILLMHCERGGWPVLAFMLAALLIYRKQYTGEQKTLEMIYKQAPRELLQLLSPLNPLPSQLRYLQYVSRRNVASEWPPLDRALTLDCVILRILPNFDGEGGCRPIFRIYGQDPFIASDRTPKVLFSMPKKSKNVRHYKQADCDLVKIDIHCHIQGDVVLECISLDEDLEREEMMFRVMFNTAFIRSNILMLNRDEIDILWNAKDQFSKDFRAEVLLSDMDATSSLITMELATSEDKEGLPIEAFAKVQEIFSNVDWLDPKGDAARQVLQQIASPNTLLDRLGIASPPKVEPMQESSLVILEQKQHSVASDNKIRKLSPSSPKQKSLPALDRHLYANAEQNSQIHDFQVAIQGTIQPKIMSQRMAASSRSAPVSHSNSLHSSPVPISRYHSAPSALGITALLHDHATYGSAETNFLVATSPPSLSAVTSRLVERPKSNNHLTPSSLLSMPVNSISKPSAAPSPPPPPPLPTSPPGPKLPSLESSTSKSSKTTSSPPPPPPPILLSSFIAAYINSYKTPISTASLVPVPVQTLTRR